MSDATNQIAEEAAAQIVTLRVTARISSKSEIASIIKTAIEKAVKELREEIRIMTNHCVQLRQELGAAQGSETKDWMLQHPHVKAAIEYRAAQVGEDTKRLDWLLQECGFTHYESKQRRVEFQWETNNFQISFRDAIDAAMKEQKAIDAAMKEQK